MAERADVAIVGGGPAGLATAIHARLAGLGVLVVERDAPPLDRPCGEGLMPDGAERLDAMGVRLAPGEQRPFAGIRYVDGGLVAEGHFPGRGGRGVRRPALHRAMAERAEELGARLRWRTEVTAVQDGVVVTPTERIRASWVVAADGRGSRVRRWAGLDGAPPAVRRFGVRRHYRTAPWSDLVEVHWGDGCEAYVTPVAPDMVGVAMLWQGQAAGGFDELLARVPSLVPRLEGARAVTRDAGAGPFGGRARTVARGRLLLVGDAGGSFDPITGEGVTLGFHQAAAAVAAMVAGGPERYRAEWSRLRRAPGRLNRLVLLLAGHPRLRRRVIRALADDPVLFSRFLTVRRHGPSAAGLAVARLGLRMLHGEA